MVVRAAALAWLAAMALAPVANGAGALPGGRALVVTTSLSPDVHLFAEPVIARVGVLIDPAEFDPERVRVNIRFAPYELIGRVEHARDKVGEIVRLRYTATLRCLVAECVAPRFRTALGEQEGGRAERYIFRFSPAEVLYEHAGGRTELLLQRPFPPLEVVSRINTSVLDEAATSGGFEEALLVSTYTASLEPPPLTYRLPPRWIAGGAFALAGLLLVFPAGLVGRAALSRWRASRRPRRRTPLERALLLIEWTSRQRDGDDDRRRAVEALADALERGGAAALAEASRTVAWAEESPDRERVNALATEASSALSGGGDGRAR